MTIAVDLGCKATKQTNKQTNKLLYFCYIYISKSSQLRKNNYCYTVIVFMEDEGQECSNTIKMADGLMVLLIFCQLTVVRCQCKQGGLLYFRDMGETLISISLIDLDL